MGFVGGSFYRSSHAPLSFLPALFFFFVPVGLVNHLLLLPRFRSPMFCWFHSLSVQSAGAARAGRQSCHLHLHDRPPAQRHADTLALTHTHAHKSCAPIMFHPVVVDFICCMYAMGAGPCPAWRR